MVEKEREEEEENAHSTANSIQERKYDFQDKSDAVISQIMWERNGK